MSLITYAKNGNLKVFWQKLNKISKKTNMSKIKLFNKFLNCFLIDIL